MQLEWFLFGLLLPIVVFGCWRIFCYFSKSKNGAVSGVFYPDYFKGLNFVLNEQPDKAIEIFIRLLEVDSGTVDIHFALGSLFRRRGEVDRAIHIHQNLIARPSLNRKQRAHALLELGMDYMHSGLLDRAENVFFELAGTGLHLEQAYKGLLDIYQQEKNWEEAITIACKLKSLSGEFLNDMIAQFYCECADIALSVDNLKEVRRLVRKAMRFHPKCARASLIEAEMQQHLGRVKLAIKAYKRVEYQDGDFITEVVEPLYKCYRKIDQVDEFVEYIRTLAHTHGDMNLLLSLSGLIAEREGKRTAIRFIADELKNHPTAKTVDRLIEYTLPKTEGEIHEYLKMVKQLTERLIEKQAIYKCNHCGFDTRTLYWQCPGCKCWETVRPVSGDVGE